MSSARDTIPAKPKFHWRDRPKGKNDPFFYRLRNMPPCSHWPNRDLPYSHAASKVLGFIFTLEPDIVLRRAISLFDMAKKKGVIKFDRDYKLWYGNKDWRSRFSDP